MEEPVKRKRGRPRKVKPEDIIPQPEGVETLEVLTWDVPKNQYIKFFDKRLSYQLTGYRPITDTKGLDFNPDWFTAARDTYLRTGKYTEFRMHSKPYNDFWQEEYRRCRQGYTVNGYTITGPNYYYLNYYQLPNIDVEIAGSGRTAIFPKFLVFQYEFFHYFEICRRQKKDCCLMKARGIGFSEINASICACIYNCFRESKCLITTSAKNFLDKSLDKVWGALNFANEHTTGGFAKLRQVKDSALLKRASVLITDNNGIKSESGWMSQIEGIVADSDAKIRGDRIDLLIYEEAGSNPVLRKSYIKGKALIYIGGSKFGIRMLGGTGGDKGPALEGLRDIYYNPEGLDVLPFYHNYTESGDWVYTGYYIPAYIGAVTEYGVDSDGVKRKLLDKRGYCLWENYKKQLDLDRQRLVSNPRALIDHVAEYCYTAEEAFSLEGENKFNKVHIAEQLTKIRALKQCPPIETGYIEYMYKNQQHIPSNITGYKWIPNKNGKVKILEHPLWELPSIENANSITPREKMRGLYVIGIDGIDIGAAQTSTATKDPSDFCLVVMKRAYGINGPQVVAIYKDRPQVLNEAYKTAIKLAQYYNAVINIEATRLSFASWARDHGYLSYFMKRPRATLSDIARGKSNQIGTPATSAIIAHQTDLIADLVNDHYETMWFEEMLDELNRYTDENKRKFDIVAALGMACLADEELAGVVPKSTEVKQDKWQDIGYYTDSNGIKRYGVIPQKQNTNIQITWDNHYEDSRVRTSNPIVANGYI